MKRLLLAALLASTSPAVLAADKPTIEELLNATDDVQRGDSSTGIMSMHIKTDRYERTVKMQMWTEGTEKSLIRILEPPKEAGVCTLKVDDNIWNYMPKVDRTMKLPASMMSGGWMGSHITNDDLVKQNRLSEDFTASVTSEPGVDGADHWTVVLLPKEDAAIVWGQIVVKVRPDLIPLAITYHDEDLSLVRTMSFHDVEEVNGQQIPMRFRVEPADKPGEFTEITYNDLKLDVDIPASTFSLQALRK
jgi:outer membrane lipoprotein-sorting protein